jgi:hypothetical protein
MSLDNIGWADLIEGRYGTARTHLEDAIAIWEKANEHLDAAMARNRLAEVQFKSGEIDLAEQTFKAVLAVREEALPAWHPEIADTLEKYAVLLRSRGDLKRAADFDARAGAIWEKLEFARILPLPAHDPGAFEVRAVRHMARMTRALAAALVALSTGCALMSAGASHLTTPVRRAFVGEQEAFESLARYFDTTEEVVRRQALLSRRRRGRAGGSAAVAVVVNRFRTLFDCWRGNCRAVSVLKQWNHGSACAAYPDSPTSQAEHRQQEGQWQRESAPRKQRPRKRRASRWTCSSRNSTARSPR